MLNLEKGWMDGWIRSGLANSLNTIPTNTLWLQGGSLSLAV